MPHRSIRMRFWPCAAALLAAAITASTVSATPEEDRTYLRNKISFRYLAQPNQTASVPVVLDNIGIWRGTETGAFWSNANIPGLKSVVRALLQEPGRGGDASLQYVASQIIKVLNKPVIIMLLDDTGPPMTGAAYGQWDACTDHHGHAWPCAFNFATHDDQLANCARELHQAVPARHDAWAGQMALGQAVFNGDTDWATSTFIHELVHTQDRSDGRAHMFWMSSRPYHYGADGTHYGVEAVPNLAATYQEGIANTLRLVVHGPRRQRMFDWFANNDIVYVEKALHPEGTGVGDTIPCDTPVIPPSDDVWLYNQLQRAGVHEIAPSGDPPAGPDYAYYRIRDLPPRFIVHNEYILALTFSEYARHMGLPRFMAALQANDATLFRVSTSPIAQLYNSLCLAGLNGRPLSSVTGVNEAGPKPYLIPLAYADYFTGYTSRSKTDYASIFENMLRPEWVDLYWDGYKDEVRAAAPIDRTHRPNFGDLTTIAITLGVNQSEPDAP
ncbi:MAG: hypothetical protein E6K76_10140 [Candidatus Eisenbacteria bacterium]|uniref:Uncharacterized protein n=1 Tax=Eiseniibacteriota bacterium TaxID=2212470 RepID=A0A538T1P8_UNCEI|nr:MAG: hypothetical protein E6K76_10140 [Candidatus Eisenbacteria bacterium]